MNIKKQAGFTLPELMIVTFVFMLVIAIVVLVGIGIAAGIKFI